MSKKILTFPKALAKILVNSFKLAIDNDFDIVLSFRDRHGEIFHVSNIENEQEVQKILLTKSR